MKKGEETRQKILDEAIVLFAESGYEKASMRELAGRVHIKAPSMYAYFSGKETLFISVCDFVFGEYRRFIRRYAAEIRPMPADEDDERILLRHGGRPLSQTVLFRAAAAIRRALHEFLQGRRG